MGVSTDASICYGIDLGDDWYDCLTESIQNELDEKDLDLSEWVEAKWVEMQGVVAPSEEYSDQTAEAYSTYWAKKREVLATCPVEVISHCHYEDPMYIVALRGTEQRASRGYPVEFNPAELSTAYDLSEWEKVLSEFGVTLPEDKEAGWLLYSDWN